MRGPAAVVARTRLAVAAVAIAAAVVLTGCSSYEGEAVGEVGDALTFSISADRKTEMTATVLDVEKVADADADEWGFDSSSDVYFVHFTADTGTTWSDWAAVTDSDEVVYAEAPRMLPAPSIPEDVCSATTESEAPCVIFAVPSGDAVTSVRYYGVNTGYNRGSGVGSVEWAAWSIE